MIGSRDKRSDGRNLDLRKAEVERALASPANLARQRRSIQLGCVKAVRECVDVKAILASELISL